MWKLAVLVAALALPARTVQAGPLLLALRLDGQEGGVVRVTQKHGHIFMAAADLRALHLDLVLPKADASGDCDLSAIAGVDARIDQADQRLDLTVPAGALARQFYDLASAAPPPSTADAVTGLMLRYDLSASADDARRIGRGVKSGANLALDFSTPQARFTTTGFVGGTAAGPVRLDSALAFDDPARLSHLNLGDAVTSVPAFARAVRFGGIEIARDFSLRPDLDTRPLPQFFGQSAVPATVDVFSGAARVFEQDVTPGPFEIKDLPVLSGGGIATVVVRDVLGRQTSQTLALYTADDLLAPGLESYALDMGFLRAGYGVSSFDYRQPMLSASWRHGFTHGLTLESHGEAAPGLALLSGGAAVNLGATGEVSADAALSNSGALFSLSAHARYRDVTFFAAGQTGSADFSDLAAEGGIAGPRQRFQLGLSGDAVPGGSFGLSLISSQFSGQPAARFLSASWTLNLHGLFVTATALRDFTNRALDAQFSLGMPLGGGAMASASFSENGSHPSGQFMYDDPADPDGGLGYRLLAADGGRYESDATYVGRYAGAQGDLSFVNGRASLRADVQGALLFLRGTVFATHDPGDAVALVETGDPGVHILRENRVVAVSDKDGEALVTGLNPYAPNHLAVETRDFPFDALLEKSDALVVPRRGGAVTADFAPRVQHPLLVQVQMAGGRAPPLGAAVHLDDGENFTTGHDGEIFIAGLVHAMGGDVMVGGGTCRIYLKPVATDGLRPHPSLCLAEAAGAY